jgi:alkylhydroperoxidase family enzyme
VQFAQHDLSEAVYAAVSQWRTSDQFSEAERVALEYAELFAGEHLAINQDLYDRLADHFEPAMIVAMTLSMACFVGLGRANQVLDLEQSCPLEM